MSDIPETQTQPEVFPAAIAVEKEPWGRLCPLIPTLSSVELFNSSYTFGRVPECDVIFDDQIPCHLNVSRQHFRLNRGDDDVVYITDLSKNGTFVNSKRLLKSRKYIIQDNDVISLSPTSKLYSLYLAANCYLPQEMAEKYFLSRILGRGAFGEVRLAHNKRTLRQFAIKKIVKGHSSTRLVGQMAPPQKIKTEVEILTSFSYPFLIKMEEVFETEDTVYLVLEYMRGGELTGRILSNAQFPESEVKFIFYQILCGVRYLHLNGITHRDLKPENVLLAGQNQYPLVKISDFGLSKIMDEISLMETTCGTINYVAPEILYCNEGYKKAVDVWSLGVMLYYMLTKTLPFMGPDRAAVARRIRTGKADWQHQKWWEISEAAKELVKRMLTLDPNQRISIGGIFNNSWIHTDIAMKYRVDQLMVSGLEEATPSAATEEIEIKTACKRPRLTLSGDSFSSLY